MATLVHGKLTFGVALADLLSEAKVYADVSAYDKLGADSTAQNTFVARCINDLVEDFLDANPALGNTVSELTVDSTDAFLFDLPATLRNMESYDLRIEYDSQQGWPTKVRWTGRRRMREYPRDGDAVGGFNGEYEATLTEAGDQIRIFPQPPSGSVVVLYHSVAPTAITANNVGTPSGVTITELPEVAQRWAALRLASDLLEPLADRTVQYDRLVEKAEKELSKVYRKISGAIGTLGNTPNYDTSNIFSVYGDYHYDTA